MKIIREFCCQIGLAAIVLLASLVDSTTNDPKVRLNLKWITNETHFPLEMSIPINQKQQMTASQSWDWLRYSDQKMVSQLPDLLLNYVISETAEKATLRLLNYNKSTHEQLSSYEPKLINFEASPSTKSREHIVNLSPHDTNSTPVSRDVFTLAYLKSHYIKYEKLAKRIKVTCIADFLVSNSNKTMLDEIMALMEHYASFKLAVKSHVSNNYKSQNPQAPNVVFIGKKQPQHQHVLNNPTSTQQPVFQQQQLAQNYQPVSAPPAPIPQPQQPVNYYEPQQAANYYQQQQPANYHQLQQPLQQPLQQQQYYQSSPPQQSVFYQSQPIPVSSFHQSEYTPVVSMYELFPNGQLLEQFQSDVQHFFNSHVNPVMSMPAPAQPIYMSPQQSIYMAPQPQPSRRVFFSSKGGFRNYFSPIDSFYRERREVKSSSVEDENEEEADYDYEKFVKLRLSLGPVSIYKPYDKEETVRCELNLINMEKLISDYRSQIYENILTQELDEEKQSQPKVVSLLEKQTTTKNTPADDLKLSKEQSSKEHETKDKSFVHLVDDHDKSKANEPKDRSFVHLIDTHDKSKKVESKDKSFVHLIDDDGKKKQEDRIKELQIAYAQLRSSSAMLSHYCPSLIFVLIQALLLVILQNNLF